MQHTRKKRVMTKNDCKYNLHFTHTHVYVASKVMQCVCVCVKDAMCAIKMLLMTAHSKALEIYMYMNNTMERQNTKASVFYDRL